MSVVSCQGWILPPGLGLPPFCLLSPPVAGTAACPTDPKLRYAAWAVTRASGGPGTLQHEVVLAGHVCSLVQSAFRAELTAVLQALNGIKLVDSNVRL